MERRYTLFGRNAGEKRWTRLSDHSYRKSTAVSIFQNSLLAPFFNGFYRDYLTEKTYTEVSLRPVKL